jgi:hypothetical protein
MGFKDVVLNITSFGAHQRLRNEVQSYEQLIEEWNGLYERHEAGRREVNGALKKVIAAKKDAITMVKKAQRLFKNLSIKQRNIINEQFDSGNSKNYSLDKIDASISAGDMAIGATQGAVAGVSTALGAWALAGSFGVASTGTAISALSGAAASNATLAWLGGGAIAAGGGGMAAGTIVLGGLVAVPVLAVSGVVQHLIANKKIAQLKEEELKVLGYIDGMENNLLQFDVLEKRSKEIITALGKASEAFQYQYDEVRKQIIYTLEPISDDDLIYIQNLGRATESVLKIVDSPIF